MDNNKNTTNVITPDSLKKDDLLTVPTPAIDNTDFSAITGGIADGIAGELGTLTEQQKLAEQNKNNSQTGITSAMEELLGKTAYSQQADETAGVNTARADQTKYFQQVTDLNAQASQLNREAQAAPIQTQQNALAGSTRGGNAPVTADALRLNALKALSIAQQADIANAAFTGSTIRLAAAKDKAQQIVDLKFKPLEDTLEIKKQQYTFLKDELERADKKKADALGVALKKEETELADKKANEKDANAYIINAIQSKAPADLVTKAQELIKKGGKATDVANILGKYSLSYSERLEQQYKATQIDKLNFEMSQARTKEAKEALVLEKAKQAQIPKVKEELDAINNLLSNTLGLEKSTALTGLGRFKQLLTPKVSLGEPSLKGTAKGLFTGGLPGAIKGSGAINVSSPVKNLEAKRDFVGTVSQLTSTGTLNNLIEAKKDGATFGALSDAELNLIQSSFSKLVSPEWAIRDKDGRIKGFRVSDDLVEEELRKIGDSTSRLYQSMGGVIDPNTPIGVQKADDFVDTALNQNINNYGYEF
tara:strand:+ start:2995 stop:4602 length:1608 start_codon:yes stop_codon:yes gene_type:complete